MSGFNFGQIGSVLADIMDTDYVDIKRNISGELTEIYSNIKCHIAFNSVDNSNPETIDIKPIIQTLTIHLPLWVDVRNDDFIIAKKTSSLGEILSTYSGRCGNPVVSQSRQKITMIMSSTESEEATPLPPQNPVIITVDYIDANNSIRPSAEFTAETGSIFILKAPDVDGYNYLYAIVNGEIQEGNTAFINNLSDVANTIQFMYEKITESPYFRFLVNGIYTTNDGNVAFGWHLYKKIIVDSVMNLNNDYIITCNDFDLIHSDNGQILKIEKGAKLVLMPERLFVKVDSIHFKVNDKVTFTAVSFNPTAEELTAYETSWYDYS